MSLEFKDGVLLLSDLTVRERIQVGYYTNTSPEWHAKNLRLCFDYIKEQNKVDGLFMSDALKEVGLDTNPRRGAFWAIACCNGKETNRLNILKELEKLKPLV